MSCYIKAPLLSTSFSENGKSAKRRFENILNTKAKKAGVFAFILLLLGMGFAGVIFGFNFDDSILYTCRTFDCSFELPQSWKNKYEIEEKYNNIVYVYHKAIRQQYGEGTGMLFYIEMLEGDNLTHDDITDPGNRTIALQEGGYTYVFGMPTDIQYPVWEGGDKELADDYLMMSENNDKIKKSVKRAARANKGGTAATIKGADLFAVSSGNIHDYMPKLLAGEAVSNYELLPCLGDFATSNKNSLFSLFIPGSGHSICLDVYPVDFPFGCNLIEKDRKSFRAESFGQVTVVESDGLQVTYLNNYEGVYLVTTLRAKQNQYAAAGITIGDTEEFLLTHRPEFKKIDSINYDDEAWFGEYDAAYAYTTNESTKSMVFLTKDGIVCGIELIDGLDGSMYPMDYM